MGGTDEVPAVRGKRSRLEAASAAVAERIVAAGIDGVGPLDPAVEVADAARARHGDVEAAIDDLVSSHRRLAAAGGFVTGLGGFVTLPVALPANVVGFYGVAARLVAGVAHLRGYDVSRPEVRSAVLLALVGADTDSVLQDVGGLGPVGKVKGRLTDLALGRLPAESLMFVNKAIGFRLLQQVGRKSLSRLGRGVPLAGGIIGGGLDWWMLRSIAETAREEFVHRAALDA